MTAPAPAFGFGKAPGAAPAAGAFGFGKAPGAPAPAAGGFGAPAPAGGAPAPAAGGFGFAKPPAAGGFGAPAPAPGAPAPATSFGFGAKAPAAGGFGAPAPAAPGAAKGFGGFGGTAPAPAGGYNFGGGAAAAPGAAAAAPAVTMATKFADLPTTVKTEVQKQQNLIREQMKHSDEIKQLFTSFPLDDIMRECAGLSQTVAALNARLEQTRHGVAALKDEVNLETRTAEHAQRILQRMNDGGDASFVSPTMPDPYFWRLLKNFERKMQQFRQNIQQIEGAVASGADQRQFTPAMLKDIMANQCEFFMGLAAQVATLHEMVEEQRAQHLEFRRVYMNDDRTNPFEEADKREERAKKAVEPTAAKAKLEREQKALLDAQAAASAKPGAAGFGTGTGGFGFGTAKPGSGFGGTGFGAAAPGAPKTGFAFGAPAPAAGGFGGFGSPAPAAPAAAKGFGFGSPAPAAPGAAKGFGFGAPAPAAGATGGFNFGVKK